jgi:hypothetical protein
VLVNLERKILEVVLSNVLLYTRSPNRFTKWYSCPFHKMSA